MSKSEQFDLRLNRRQMMLMSGVACAYGMCGQQSYGQEVAGLNGKFFCTAHGPIRSEQARVTAAIARRNPAAAARIQSKAPARGLGAPSSKDIHVPLQLAVDKESQWTTREVTYQFVDDDFTLQSEIRKAFDEWHPHTGLDFRQVSSGGSIKIAFRNQGYWSYVGMYSVDSGKPITLNIQPGNVGEYRRATLHEVGHALGAIHEHQAPSAANIPWDVGALNNYYNTHFGWTPQDVQEQVINLYQGNVSNSAFDNTSIMVYVIPREVLLPGADPKFIVPTFNQELSLTDKNFMRQTYGIAQLSGDGGATQNRIEIKTDRQKLRIENAKTLKAENSPKKRTLQTDPPMDLYKIRVDDSHSYVFETVDVARLETDKDGKVTMMPMSKNAIPMVLELFDGTDFSEEKILKNGISKFGVMGAKPHESSIGVQDAFLTFKLQSKKDYYLVARPQQRPMKESKWTYTLLVRKSNEPRKGVSGTSWSGLKGQIETTQAGIRKTQGETKKLLDQLRK